MEKLYLVYKHTNKLNGKIYIGITYHIENPNIRWDYGGGYSRKTPFGKAIQKYGWSNFEHEILETNLTEIEAKEKEQFYIALFHSYILDPLCNGYNATKGGDNGGHMGNACYQIDKETLQIIAEYESVSQAGTLTGVCGRNINACCQKGGQNTAGGYYWCFVKDYNEEWQPPLSQLNKARERAVIFENTGEIFSSIKEASEKTGYSKQGIYACCSGRQKSVKEKMNTKGYFKYYIDDNNENTKKEE